MIKCIIIILIIFIIIELNKNNTIFNATMPYGQIESFNESDLVKYERSYQTSNIKYW